MFSLVISPELQSRVDFIRIWATIDGFTAITGACGLAHRYDDKMMQAAKAAEQRQAACYAASYARDHVSSLNQKVSDDSMKGSAIVIPGQSLNQIR